MPFKLCSVKRKPEACRDEIKTKIPLSKARYLTIIYFPFLKTLKLVAYATNLKSGIKT